MTTTDLTFLFLFLPLSLAVCRGGVKLRKYILLMVSLLFYACGSPDHFLLLGKVNSKCEKIIKNFIEAP